MREFHFLPSTVIVARLEAFLKEQYLTTGNRTHLVGRVANFLETENFGYTIEAKVFVDCIIDQVLRPAIT